MSIKFTVVSMEDAENDLTAIWLAASSSRRAMITKASNHLENELRFDSHLKGVQKPTAQHPTRRVLHRTPLRVYFDVSEPDRLVQLLRYFLIP